MIDYIIVHVWCDGIVQILFTKWMPTNTRQIDSSKNAS